MAMLNNQRVCPKGLLGSCPLKSASSLLPGGLKKNVKDVVMLVSRNIPTEKDHDIP